MFYVVRGRPLHIHNIPPALNCRVLSISYRSQRSISLFQRKPLYKPRTPFGRFYLRFRNFTLGLVTISIATFSIFYVLDARSALHRYIVTPTLRFLTSDAEDAHRLAILALKYGLHPRDTRRDDPRLAVTVGSRIHRF